jgi:hypothetical protein
MKDHRVSPGERVTRILGLDGKKLPRNMVES